MSTVKLKKDDLFQRIESSLREVRRLHARRARLLPAHTPRRIGAGARPTIHVRLDVRAMRDAEPTVGAPVARALVPA